MFRRCVESNWFLIFSVLIGMFLIVSGYAFSITSEKVVAEEKKEIPTMKISLEGTSLAEVQENGKNVKYEGNEVEIVEGEEILDFSNVEFKGHGNFSWNAEKKSYRIKFEKKVDLFGMGKSKKWLLIANSVDDSLIRNDLAYFMAGYFENDFQGTGEFINLEIDGEDLGVYYLLPVIEISKSKVDLRDELGVLVEVDNVYCEQEERWWRAKNGDCLTVKDSVMEENTEEAMKKFLEAYNKMVKAIAKKDFEAVSEVIDIQSFAEYFIMSEFTSNPDAYVTSWYLYKDGEGDKIHAGVVWDFDAAFGNKSWGKHSEEFYSPETGWARFREMYGKNELGEFDKSQLKIETSLNVSFVIYDLCKMPEFLEVAKEVYLRDFRDRKEEIIDYIYQRAEEISEAAERDAEIWEKGSFREGIEYLVDWIERRFEFFNEEML